MISGNGDSIVITALNIEVFCHKANLHVNYKLLDVLIITDFLAPNTYNNNSHILFCSIAYVNNTFYPDKW
jgi:hypothetical protein